MKTKRAECGFKDRHSALLIMGFYITPVLPYFLNRIAFTGISEPSGPKLYIASNGSIVTLDSSSMERSRPKTSMKKS